ncbi:MAG: lysoplasmalogenase [Lysobacteraceae bacterium]|nr:MAG: lysoplasmalogenase [Xanthomonadaceae bacterium]
MPPRNVLLTRLIIASAVGAIAGALLGGSWIWLHYVCKPLTTILLLAVAMGATAPVTPRYRLLICVGLVLSLAGDVFLMLPGDWFVFGLASFLLAHLFYVVAFAPGSSAQARLVACLVYAAIAIANLVGLLPRVPAELHVPVLAYVAVLMLMGALAAARGWSLRGDARLAASARLAAIGGALFVFSDSVLAWNRFGGGIPLAPLWVLAGYYASCWCIARSVDAGQEVAHG